MKLQVETDGYQPPKAGLILLQFIIGALFVIFCSRFWYLQIHKGPSFVRMAQDNRLRQERIFAPRGEIYDVNGVLLAENRSAFGLALTREDCPDIPATLAQVSAWTGIPLERLEARYEQDRSKGRIFDPILLLTDMPFSQVARVETELLNWPGLQIVTHAKRDYSQGALYAHILGYVAEANEQELAEDKALALGDTVGRQGLEIVLEQRLRGKKGMYSLEVDAFGRPLNRILVEAPEGGENVRLSLDTKLQQQVVEAMGEYSGCVVVMEPFSGKLRAMVTLPAYDNNLFIGGLSQVQWDELRFDKRFPLQNRGIQSMYPPGSVWKLMMAGMLLEAGVSPSAKVHCPGVYTLGNREFRCWRRGGHGSVDMARSLIESCDVYYYVMGEKYGIDRIEAFAKSCGFGSPTGIALPHEKGGLVPSRTWKQATFGERWQGGETVNVSIGQGHTLVTPLQVATFISALVNGGSLLTPQLLDDAPREERSRLPVSDAYRALIVDFMQQTVEDPRATAKVLKRPDLRVGGKTGTAQVVKIKMIGTRRQKTNEMLMEERDHAWIASWGERDGQTYVVVTMLEHGGGGASMAGPVTKKVYEALFPLPPKPEPAAKASS